MKTTLLALTLLGLAACSPPVPDSGMIYDQNGGLNSDTAQGNAAPVAQGQEPILPPAADVATTTLDTPPADSTDAAPPAKPAAIDPENPAISDEQDFGAVSARESIQSDAERLAAQRDAYQVIEPTALPSRSGPAEPNIVEYALSTHNAVGQSQYRRGILSTTGRFMRNCNKYASPDLAQEAFLRSGGPKRDRMGLDPDGDGFACAWDPTPFRQATAPGG